MSAGSHFVASFCDEPMVRELENQEPVTTWLIDDTGFPKQGKHSVGVQRQIGASLTSATRHEHVPIDFALSMPQSWTDDAVRREKSRAADDFVSKTKLDLVDAAYGASSEFMA